MPPVVSLVTAAGITRTGAPVDATVDFGATDPDVVAVVDVGYLGNQRHETLTVAWFRAAVHGGLETLFSQRVGVASGDIAYAAALNTGRMALGLYSVEATLDGTHRSGWFVVYDPNGLDTPVIGTTSDDPTTSRIELDDDTAPSNSSEGATAAAAPPVSGPSGTVTPPSNPPGGTGCQLEMDGSVVGTVLAEWSGCAGDDVGLSATVNGETQQLATLHAGDASVPLRVDPCSVNPGIGYGTASIGYTATVLAGPDKGKSATVTGNQTVQAPTNPPLLLPVDYVPDIGSQVGEGDEISLTFEAQSASGIKSVTVSASPGGLLKQETWRNRTTRCTTAGTDETVVVPSYKVPGNPPPIVTITAVATDFGGRSQTIALQYPTEAVWSGIVLGTGTAKLASTEHPGQYGLFCSARWTMFLQIYISATKAVSGAAQARSDSIPCKVIGPDFVPTTFPGGNSTFKVTGTYDGTEFRLQFTPVQTNQAYSVGSLFLLNTDGTSDFAGNSPATFVFIRKNDTSADGILEITGPGVRGGVSLGLAQLKLDGGILCCYASVGPALQATKTPPIFLP